MSKLLTVDQLRSMLDGQPGAAVVAIQGSDPAFAQVLDSPSVMLQQDGDEFTLVIEHSGGGGTIEIDYGNGDDDGETC